MLNVEIRIGVGMSSYKSMGRDSDALSVRGPSRQDTGVYANSLSLSTALYVAPSIYSNIVAVTPLKWRQG